MEKPLFLNLYYLRDNAFRDHNFTDFWNDGSGGDPIQRVGASEIESYISASYEPDKTRPERMEGFPPDFNPIFPLTLSIPSSDAFIRTHPDLPITARDYLLSKAYQFLYVTIATRYPPKVTSWGMLDDGDIRFELHRILNEIPDELLGKLCEPDLNWWWGAYSDTTKLDLEETLRRLKTRFRREFRVSRRSRQAGKPLIERRTTDAEARVRENELVTPQTAALYLNASPRHIRRLVVFGKLATV